jgi:isoamylase
MRHHSGEPWPLGATCTTTGVNFALYSVHAETVELCLFDENDREHRVSVIHRTGDIWHIDVHGLTAGQRYGYRVGGAWQPAQGHRFNPNKLLLDPYARELTGIPRICAASYDYLLEDEQFVMNVSDNAAHMPKCVVTVAHRQRRSGPVVRTADSLIYELHVKGFTRLHPALGDDERGRYAGLGSQDILAYLKDLGVTSLELLPVQEFVDESFLTDRKLVNYWGYNPLGFFTPTMRYARQNPTQEFAAMVDQIHDAGFEVILDVVYNHTAEGGQTGPTMSFRGIDNATYYRLQTDDRSQYVNDSGCGNSLNVADPGVLQMVTDSLRYWVELGVDGFRFDLATSLGRDESGFSSRAAFFQVLRQDPVLGRVKLIAEPWDLGPGGYQLGQFPRHWSEWNDQYRDTVRRFWRGDAGVLPDFARQVHGASDLFEGSLRPPQSGINFVTSHDGFTLADLVSFSDKRNEANLEANHDGHHENYTFNCGIDGDTDDPGVLRLRARQQRNLLSTLLLSQGVPMILAGDEIARTQHGNNNSYCQDNELNWVDWSRISHESELLDFTRRVIAIRKSWVELRSSRFIHGNEYVEGLDEIEWYHARGDAMQPSDWQDPTLYTVGLMLHGAAIFPGRVSGTRLILAIFNTDEQDIDFTTPEVPLVGEWHCQLSSAESWTLNTPPGSDFMVESKSIGLFEFREFDQQGTADPQAGDLPGRTV